MIALLIMRRTYQHLKTNFHKVKAHIGTYGNEFADRSANDALCSPSTCKYSIDDSSNHYLASLPAWPCLPTEIDPTDTVVNKFRPDILIIEGLTPSDISNHDMHDPVTLTRFQRTCKIHILEIGYASDSSYLSALDRKKQQHIFLCQALQHAGWQLSYLPQNPIVP